MRSRGTGLFEWWRSQRETGDLLRRTNQLRLPPAHLTQLLGDSGVRAALQGTKMASLLPPVGTEVFRRLTPASLERMQQEAEEAESQVKKKKNKKAAKSDRPEPACDLEAGKPLPFFYGAPPPELLNTPLEELDPFYQSQKTFVVLGKGNVLYRFSAESSCYLLTPFNLLRSAAIRVLLHSLFSLFMTATILTNCAFMMLSEPPAWSRSAEHVFTAIYTLEVIIKVTSRGLCLGHFTFLRDPWNWLDVLVILTGLRPFLESGLNDVIFLRVPWNWLNFLIISKIYLSEIFYLKSVSVLKTIPRILKIIAVSPGLRSTVRGLITLVRRLADVIMLTVFWLCVLALIGLQLFMGSLRRKCVISRWTLSDENISLTETQFDFNEYINNKVNYYYLPGQLDALLCGNSSDAGVCPEGFVCLMAGNNPNYGFTSYDSFGWSLLNMIRLLSQDFWENLLQMTLRSSGKFYLSFFLLVVFPSCFCIFCLMVAAVVMACVKREEVGATEAREREEEFREVLETLKRTEDEEQASCGMALSQGQDRHNNQHQGHTAGTGTCSDVLLKWECCGCWRWLHQRLHTVITNPFFDLAIIVCIIVDILFMSMEHYPMTEEFAVHLSIADLVFQLVYTVELLLKLVALGPCGYFKVNWNVFDCIIITVTLLNLVLADIQGLSVLRTFRLLRMFRLARWWPSLHDWLRMVSTSVRALREPTILLLVLTFFFSVVGMQLFGTDYKDHVCRISMDCQLPRWHMNDFFHAFLVVFRALTGESVETLWDCMQVSGQPLCLIFFMVLLVLGNLLMLNLFLVLLLSPLSSYSLTEEKKKISMQISINRIQRAVRTLLGKKTQMDPDHKAVSSDQENRKELLAMTAVTSEQPESEVTALSSDQNSDSCWVSAASDVKVPEREKDKEKKKHDEDDEGHIPEDCCNDKCYRCCPFLDKDMSRGGGRVWSNFRRTCCSLVQHRGFDAFIIVIIVASSTALAFEDVHLQQRTVLKTVLKTADQVFTFILLMEVILKIIAFGLKKYFTDAWCWLDFLVLHVFLVSLAADTFGAFELGAISFLRTLRALGPLRVLSRFQGPRLVVGTLVRSVPSLLNVLLVSLQVWLFFGLLGVNFFAGKFYHCFNETSEERVLPEVVDNKSECFSLIMHNFTEIRWKNIKNINFDNTNNAYLSLLHVMTGDDFDIIYAAVDTRQVESQLVYESKPYAHLYFIFFTIFGVFFTFNFIIRHIMDNLLRDKICRRLFVTEEQQKFWAVMKMRALRPQKAVPRPQGVCLAGLFDLVTGAPFSVLMAVVICLNMVVLMIETRDQSETMDIVLYWLHFVFILIFLIEFILKIIALGRHYFSDGYNVLDFLVLIITIVGLFLADLIEKYFLSPVLFSVLRLCRVARLFSLLRFARGIGKLLLSLMMSLPVLFNVGVLLLVLVVASSIFAMFNFAYVRKAYMIDDMFNFETFWSSFICLIMTTMTASWGGLLMALTNTPPDCDPFEEHPGSTVTGDCGSPMLAIIFFCTHVALSLLLIVHLYVAVILKILEPDNGTPLSDDQLQMFYEIWRRFDLEGSQSIQYSQLSEFCDALKDPLRVPNPNSATLIHMDLPRLPGDQIHCADVLFALSTQVFGFSGQLETLKVKMEEKFVNNSAKEPPELVSSTLQRNQEDVEMAVI